MHLSLLLFTLATLGVPAQGHDEPLRWQNRRELFLDDFLVTQLSGLEARLATPHPAGVVLRFDQPWEGRFSGAFVTVLNDGEKFRMYYRCTDALPDASNEVTAYAESADGIRWTRPMLRLFEFAGNLENNLIMPTHNALRTGHNFSVLDDERPGVPAAERFKAVGGGLGSSAEHKANNTIRALYRYVSADGINWRRASDDPLFQNWALDSQNVLAWIPAEKQYAIYLRTWIGDRPGHLAYKGVRTIARSVSQDFVHWSEPVPMSFGGTQDENLYTNATKPYFRAPQLLIAMPFRFSPDRRLLSDEEMREHDIHPTMWSGVSDAVILTSRGGNVYDRKFLESFIRPGLDRSNWAARSNIPALGILQTSPTEMSIYLTCGYGSKDRRIERQTLRLDGFASLHAGYQAGFALTRPLILDGNTLEVNLSTSSIGYLKVVVQDETGEELPGFGQSDAVELAGDFIVNQVKWKSGKTLAALKEKTVRLKLILRDADLYSIGVFDR